MTAWLARPTPDNDPTAGGREAAPASGVGSPMTGWLLRVLGWVEFVIGVRNEYSFREESASSFLGYFASYRVNCEKSGMIIPLSTSTRP